MHFIDLVNEYICTSYLTIHFILSTSPAVLFISTFQKSPCNGSGRAGNATVDYEPLVPVPITNTCLFLLGPLRLGFHAVLVELGDLVHECEEPGAQDDYTGASIEEVEVVREIIVRIFTEKHFTI